MDLRSLLPRCAPLPDEAPQGEARERIILAAFRLFGRQGYARTSVSDIADAAGVKKPLLYYYFPGKQALYQSLFQQSQVLLGPLLDDALHRADEGPALPEGRAATQLAAVMEALLRLARENADPVRFFLAHTFAPDADRPVCDTSELERFPLSLVQGLAQEGVRRGELAGEPALLACLIVGGLQLSLLRHLRSPEQEPLRDGLGAQLVRAAVRGFLSPPAASVLQP